MTVLHGMLRQAAKTGNADAVTCATVNKCEEILAKGYMALKQKEA